MAGSIDWNERSAASALGKPVAGAVSLHYLHALDYLAYANLQRGDDTSAARIRQTLQALQSPVQRSLPRLTHLRPCPRVSRWSGAVGRSRGTRSQSAEPGSGGMRSLQSRQ